MGARLRDLASLAAGRGRWGADSLQHVRLAPGIARLTALAVVGALVGAWWSMSMVGAMLWLCLAAITGRIDIVAGFWFVARFAIEFAPLASPLTSVVTTFWLTSAIRLERRISAHRTTLAETIAAAATRP
jgi:hypothetical protein